TDHRRRLQETLLLGWQSINTRCQYRLYRGWHVQAGQRLRQAIGPALADQYPGFHQGTHALFQKEWVTLGPGDQYLRERWQSHVVPKQRVQEFVRAHRGQRVEAQLCVIRLAAPAVLVLGAIVHQEQEAGGRQALDQALEQGLRLRINPVQVLEHQQQRLLL